MEKRFAPAPAPAPAPGLEIGAGEIGVRGAALGDLRGKEERAFWAAEMLRESFGFAARAAYILSRVIYLIELGWSRCEWN